ncbi:NAD(P)H-binding protein [Chryseobacterium wanjuense]
MREYLVQHLLDKNYSIKLLLRNPDNFTLQNPLIEVVKGDARNIESIKDLVYDCDVVISTLGQPKGEKVDLQ